uniref:BESS domain-containing protein n=1 Tax=Ditylenchus dipsaci TaxID=166011 RepID=A0A915CNR2_9BILA
MCVKGEKANMQIYGADISQTYETKQPKTPPSSFVPKTPPMELRPQTPNQLEETSEQPTDNSLAERDVLSVLEALPELHQLTTAANLNRQLLKNVQKLMNERITEKLEIERQSTFPEFADDYSDEEEDEERTKNESSAQVFSKEHILSVAKSMLAEGVLSQELQQIHQQSTGQPRARTPPEANSHQQPFSFPHLTSQCHLRMELHSSPYWSPPPAIQPGQMMHNFSTSRPPPKLRLLPSLMRAMGLMHEVVATGHETRTEVAENESGREVETTLTSTSEEETEMFA